MRKNAPTPANMRSPTMHWSLVGMLALLNACIGGAGTSGPAGGTLGAAPGQACNPATDDGGCYFGTTPATVVACTASANGGVWQGIGVCPTGSVCVEQAKPGASHAAMKIGVCTQGGQVATADGAAVGGNVDTATAADNGTSGGSRGSGDAVPGDSDGSGTDDAWVPNVGPDVQDAAPADVDGGPMGLDAPGDGSGGSCVGLCGTSGDAGNCYCDAACVEYGDCCFDYKKVCGSPYADADAYDSGKPDGVTTDTGAPKTCVPKCLDDQKCIQQANGSYQCVGPPCGGPCPSGSKCNATTNKCEAPCPGGCPSGQVCDASQMGGTCVPVTCTMPTASSLAANVHINKISKLALLPKAQGCDLNGDGYPDNGFGKMLDLYSAINDPLSTSIADGTRVMLLIPDGFSSNGQSFTCHVASGAVDKSAASTCDPSQAGSCKYLVRQDSLNLLTPTGACAWWHQLTPVKVQSGALSGGGAQSKWLLDDFDISSLGLSILVRNAMVSGVVSGAGAWQATAKGLLCGVVTQADLDAAIDAMPDEQLAKIGFDKATIKGLFAGLLKLDIDSNGDGTIDAISIAFSFESFQAEVTGYLPAP